MRSHQWWFLAVGDSGSPAQGWTARVVGICKACGLTRVLEIDAHHDHRFDLSGDCRNLVERAEDRRLAQRTP